ncbi:MAG: S-methyl-5'-thioadenosine phosphorylase [Acidobacteriota bacterium]|jgi:5'-methylthioadenosine phosphorylase|nr:S-methyl-5'-thioadenosine phosphorylase [Acidobacteriota bacterium]NLT33964.1 S-methyl-5'-thioadenosine phosphorylase [Acidobacteriota bacterium]
MEKIRIGIIGGSGLYDMAGLEQREEVAVATPFGDPSDRLVTGTLAGKRVAFLARHGRGHRLMPSELNFRANIYAMKTLGVERILSVGAVGSLRESIAPLDIVLPDQFLDRTRGRVSTFFGDGLVAHISFGDPVCPDLLEQVFESSARAGFPAKKGGTYVCMEGPAFSTRAESILYRNAGMDVIGMTNLQEAKLAREAEICYVTIALVTDYDCWHDGHETVSADMIIGNLERNCRAAEAILARTVADLDGERKCSCGDALKYALITRPEAVSPEAKARLAPIVGRYLP